MRAEIKSLDLVDYEDWAYWPDDPKNFCVAGEALIGPENSEGSEIYSFEVCSPKWFSENRLEKPTFVRHVIFINEYDEQAVKHLIRKLAANTSGKNWNEISEKLARFMLWEFEDYQPAKSPST